MRFLNLFILSFLFVMCSKEEVNVDFQGHRGARGLLPENTIPAFEKALEIGVNTLELDLSVSKDSVLIVSHEPWFNHEISSHPDGKPVLEEEARGLRLFEMNVDEIQTFDVGSRGNPRFPDQKPMKVAKPRFKDVVVMAEKWASENNVKPPYYNIETKSMPEGDNIFHPTPEEFVKLILDEINELGIKDRVIVQSFDLRTLISMHQRDPDVVLALLVEDASELPEALNQLSFVPEIYSPEYVSLTDDLISMAKSKGMKIIPWTVNEVDDMKSLLKRGVDGLISDYPNRFVELEEYKKSR